MSPDPVRPIRPIRVARGGIRPTTYPVIGRDVPFREIIDRPYVAKEFFLPENRASWVADRYTLGKADRSSIKPSISGVRLQERDPNQVRGFRETAVQSDFRRLVQSVSEVRKHGPFVGTVLSEEHLLGVDPGIASCKRVVFGLVCPENGQFKEDVAAAAECHRQILHAIKCGGYRLEPGAEFDPQQGMRGLADWADKIRLEKRWEFKWLWLSPLLLLLFLPLMCMSRSEVPTESYIILVDRSNITPKMAKLRAEVKQLLEDSVKIYGPANAFANVIYYDGKLESVLGRIRPLDRKTLATLNDAIDQPAPERGTRLDSAMKMAAAEIKEHGKKTTMLILTDGDEDTIRKLKAAQDALLKSAGKDGSPGGGGKGGPDGKDKNGGDSAGGKDGGKGDSGSHGKVDPSLPERLRGAKLIKQEVEPGRGSP